MRSLRGPAWAAVPALTLAAVFLVPAGPAAAAPPDDLPEALHGMHALLGEAAPAFVLAGADGGSVSLAELRRGDPVIVVQLWATWCVPCHIEALVLKQMLARFSRDDLVVVGLHANDASQERIPEIRARLGMDFPVAVATDEVWRAYGNTPYLPASVIIGRDGRVRRVELGVKWVDEVEPLLRDLVAETVEEAKVALVSDTDLDWGNNNAPERAAAGDTPAAAGL